MSKNEKCPHAKPESCPECSMVKMVAYLLNDDKIVWYSYFKEDKRFKRAETVAGNMGQRLEKKHGQNIKKMMFFDNLQEGKPMIGES